MYLTPTLQAKNLAEKGRSNTTYKTLLIKVFMHLKQLGKLINEG